MRLNMMFKRFTAMMMAIFLLITMFPVSCLAESDIVVPATTTDLPADVVTDSFAEDTLVTEPLESSDTETTDLVEGTLPEGNTVPTDTSNSEQVVGAPVETEVPQPADDDAHQDTPAQQTLTEIVLNMGHAYVIADVPVKAYSTADMTEAGYAFTILDPAPVLVTDVTDFKSLKIWLLADDALQNGYIAEAAVERILTDEEIGNLSSTTNARREMTDAGERLLLPVSVEFPVIDSETIPNVETIPEVNETEEDHPDESEVVPVESPVEEAPTEETEQPGEDDATHSNDESADEGNAAEEPGDEAVTDSETAAESIISESPAACYPGDYVHVTTETRVYTGVDESATNDYFGDLYFGNFTRDAVVIVEETFLDTHGYTWLKVKYKYGDTFTDGRLKWTATDTVYTRECDVTPANTTELTVTDCAYPIGFPIMRTFSRSTTAMNGFSLKEINGSIGSFTVGQTASGSSGRDRDYAQIATLEGHGKIYATPHYLEGYVVYCLEHTLPGPGENISGGGKQPTGPYLVVDWGGYQGTPGYSGAIYGEDTMHAIAWVLRHTYPFMALDRSDSNNETWSRVAGQFAIREVIKQMEGSQYVRDYWDMDNFYAASNNAPAVYLEYARWLATNGIRHARVTGNITVANKTAGYANGTYYGTATFTTDADYMRVSKNVGKMTGYTAGEDDLYYYLNSGDTVTVYSSSNSFAYGVESMADDEAKFYVGIPEVAIQKVLIPIEGDPYTLKETSVDFSVSFGAVIVTKQSAVDGSVLPGAAFTLLDSSGNTVQTATTGSNGTVVFDELLPGAYTVKETGAPTGYTISVPAQQTVKVTAGLNSSVTFSNEPIKGRIKIVKTDAETQSVLAGAVFTVADSSGTVVATLTTDANGTAETDWLPYGSYTVAEIKAPDRYINSGFSTTIHATDNGKIYALNVENEPMQGGLRLTKTDAVNGTPIAGVRFDIYSGTTLVGSMTTGTDGVAVSGNLPRGEYTVKEHALPTGYTGNLVEMTASVTPNSVTELSATNTPSTSRIKIIKKDSLTGAALANAKFTVSDSAGNVVAIITTGTDGVAVTDWLRYGTYTVEETAAPNHYVNEGFTTTVEAFENGKTYEFTVTNAPTKGGIRLTKTDASNNQPIAGVTFSVYSGTTLVGSMTTDANGVATIDGLAPGSYTVREDALPTGYTGDLVVLEAAVQSDVTCELEATNTPSTSKIKIVKVDSLTLKPVSGAEFTVVDSDGNMVATIATNADGVAATDWLRYGVYTVTETKAADHYINSGYVAVVEAFENGVTYTFEVQNEPTKGYLQITKSDALDGTLIEGVQFDIYRTGELIATMTTGADGVATSEALPKGTYTVKEHSLPEGYTGELVTMEAVVKSDETTQLTASNQPIMGQIRVKKSDALTGEMLAGAEFTIIRNTGLPSHKGSNDGEVVAVMITDANGVAVSPMLTWGNYRIEETKVPEHYIDNGFSAEVIISEDQKTYTIEAENEPTMGYIRIVKTNSLDQTPIAGVIFDISQNSQVIGSIVTDEDGVAVSDPLPKGIYTVSERDTPLGYVYEIVNLKAEVCSDETTELVVTNKPIEGKFRIEKRDSLTGDRLAGAIFTITRISGLPSHNGSGNGEVVATITTDINGVAETPWLIYGVYRVEETGVPEHYVDNGFSVEAVINEEDMGTYLVDCENEPTKGWIQLVKVDALDRTPIAGVVFDIYDGGELVSSMTTNADGVALSEPLHKGEYMVYERDNPTGYTGELNMLEAVVKSDETTHLSCTNQPIQGRIQIMKRDQLTKEALAGAEFTVTRIAGLLSHNGSNDGEVVAVITTDANGMAISPLLTWGTYRVEETGVPEHYVDNSFSVEVTITEDQKIYTVDVENEPTKGWIRLTKTDRLNGNPIEGVQFDIFYNDQYGEGLAGTMVTDASGIALSEPLRKGQYIVREHGETAGYVFEEIELAATVKSDEITDVAATNMPVLVQLTIYKRDLDEYDGDDPNTNPRNKAIPTMPNDYNIPDPATRGDGVLTGTVFQVSAGADILDRQGNVIYPEGTVIIDSLTTAGDAASVTTEPLWPGLYAVQEIAAPTGYQIDPNPFFVDTSGAAMQSAVPTVVFPGLSRNEILYGAQAIVKVLGNNDNTTDPTRVEIPEPQAEFKVYLKSAGSYEAARDFECDYLITDENGYAMTKPLPYGVYVLEQTAGKDGYEIKGPIEFSIDGTENLDNPPPLTLSDKPILYRLKLIKTDADTGKIITLANTSFKIKDSQGKYITQTVYYPREMEIDTFTTDATGSVTLPEVINWGHYFIEEIKAPEGYLIRTDELAVFIGNAGDQPGQTYEVEIEIPNESVMGRIELVKTGLTLTGFMTANEHGYEVTRPVYEDRYLAGATFEIRAAEDIIGGDGTLWYTKDALVETITTSGTGSDMSKELPLGRYYLIETGAPVGYILEDVPYEADLTYLDGNTPVVTIQVKAGNKYLPASVALVKHKEVTEVVTSENGMVHQVITTAPGEGFTFGLYNAKDIHYVNGTLMADTLMAVGVTDEQGLLHISGYFPHGEYYIKELAAPAGWHINPDAFPVSIQPDMVAEDAAVIQIVYPEVIYDELIYTPITLTKTDITGVDTLPGALIEVMNSEGTLIYREFTDDNGEIPDIPVVPGTYTFREVYAPEGYELNTTEMTFTVDELGNITGDTVIRDDYTRVTLVKQDMNGNPLAGVEFGLLKDDEFLVAVAQSDTKGIVTFEKIPFGKYTIREVQPLPGYLLNDTVVHLTVDNTFSNPSEPLAVIENHPIEVILHKIDKDNKPLPGAIFGLFDSDGFLCMTALSDVTGTVKFSYVSYGSYTIREMEAPDGYLLSQTVIPVEIDENYQNSVEPLATVVNQAARLQYKKVDTSGKLLPGVEFSLINADTGEIVEIVTSDDAGEFVFTLFTFGNWIIRETKAPEGYNIMPDIELTVDENWVEPEPFTLVNIPNHYEFVKTDNKGNPMPGVKFTLEDGAGNILRDLVSGEDGIVHVTDLTPGVYIIREIETLEGFTRSEETIKVVIDEKYVIPKEMYKLINYPNIQTGSGIAMTPVMWCGIILALCALLSLAAIVKLRKHYIK